MTTYRQGDTAQLVALFYEYDGGPAVDVTNIQITITPLGGGAAVVGPTAVGITHPATGTYVYSYVVPDALPLGEYLVTWTNDEGATATEIFSVIASASAGSTFCDGWDPIWNCELPTGSGPVTGTAVEVAASVLYGLSGRRFGLCTVTLRPCRQDCYGDSWPTIMGTSYGETYPTPALYAGQWYNITCGSCTSGCSCAQVSEVTLPGPVFDITQVKVDGVVLTPGIDYRLDSNRFLVRLGGEMWPLCNDINLADTEVGTWSVTYRHGEPLSALGKMALGELAAEFAKALVCDEGCRLPKPVQSLSRQGVDLTFLDPNEVFQAGRTGLYLPDLFLTTENPRAMVQRSRVYDIDNPHRYRRTG